AQRRDLRLQRERLPVSEQVRLLDLRRRDEVLDRREARADLERARGPLGDLEVDVDALGRRALLRRDVDALEVTERDDAALAVFELRLREELTLLDFHFATEHLVARLRVALDLDALDVHERTAADRHDDVDLALHRIELGLRLGLDVRVARVAIQRAHR